MYEGESREHLDDHFADHGPEVGAATLEEFGASAQRTIARGTIFSYEDRGTGEPRIGHYDRATSLFAALNEDERKLPRLAATDLKAVLGLIEASPAFRAAAEAERERRRLHPTPEERADRERGEATVERFRLAREERLARATARQ